MNRVCCLYRVSTLGQVEKDDIPMQKQRCHEFAESHGWTIVKEFSEKGVSGFKVATKDRDAIQEIKKDALNGKFDILLVFMFDRLGRRDDESPFVVEWFTKNGVEVWSAMEGQQRFDNHVDKLTNYIRFWQAAGESEKTSIRTKTRLGQLVQEGRFKGGYCPYGFKLVKAGRINNKGFEVNEIIVDDYEASVIKFIFEKYVNEGIGTFRIANMLTSNGIKCRSGKSWHASTVLNMLKNVAYTGVLKSGETRSEIFDHLQIVDELTFSRAQALIKARGKSSEKVQSAPMGTKGKSLLSGNVFCGHCGARLIATTSVKKTKRADGSMNEKKRLYYVCYNKSTKRFDCNGQYTYMMKTVDEIVESTIRQLFERLTDSPEEAIFDSYFSSKLKDCQAKVKHDQRLYDLKLKELKSLEDEVLKVLSGSSQFSSELLNRLIEQKGLEVSQTEAELRVSRSVLENDLKIASDARVKFKELLSWAGLFDECSLETKKMIVSCLIERVIVKRGYELVIEFSGDFEVFLGDLG